MRRVKKQRIMDVLQNFRSRAANLLTPDEERSLCWEVHQARATIRDLRKHIRDLDDSDGVASEAGQQQEKSA